MRAADFNGDRLDDLAVASSSSKSVSILLSAGDGTFRSAAYPIGEAPAALVITDLNGDHVPDVVTANYSSNVLSFLSGQGHGTFQDAIPITVGSNESITLVAADFNGDGRKDLATVDLFSTVISINLGLVGSQFITPEAIGNDVRSIPKVGDLSGDGASDLVVVNRQGEILFRRGRINQPGTFEPPVIVNPDPAYAARDVTILKTKSGPRLVAVDAKQPALSFYTPTPQGGFARSFDLPVPDALPVRVTAADLNGDKLDDLVVTGGVSNQVLIYFQSSIGDFGLLPDAEIPLGNGPSDIAVADVNGDLSPDIIATNKAPGDIGILLNQRDGSFAPEVHYRTGTGLYGLDSLEGNLVVRSSLETAGVVAGPFVAGDPVDAAVVNTGSDTISLLRGTGSGGFYDVESSQMFNAGLHPTTAVTGRFDSRSPYPEIAVLDEGSDQIAVYSSDGAGGFNKTFTASAGNSPTDLSAFDINGDGNLDLLVGNEFGDVLILLGNGDGTFQPYRRADLNTALAVADLNGDGQNDFVFTDQAQDRVSIQYGSAGPSVFQDRTNGLLAPGAVVLADLNGDGKKDLVVANSGGNNVLVYPGLGDGEFGSPLNGTQGFFAGTDPAGITVADVNGDGRPDLVVANKGSNDVSVLLNQPQGNSFTFTPGPRLKAGFGPVSTVVKDVTGDGIPDVLVSNSLSNNVMLLPGVGSGFFNDVNPTTFSVGSQPGPLFVGNFDGKPDLVTVNAGSNNLTLISDFLGSDPVTTTISSGGLDPVAAFEFSSGSGFDNLVVANSGDGTLALFEGGPDGLTPFSTGTDPELPNPTDLAFSALTGGEVQFYGATEGREAAVLVALSLVSETAPEEPSPSPSPPAAPSLNTVAQLVPLQESSLALVGSLLITTIGSPGNEASLTPAETEAAAAAVEISTTTGISVGQGLLPQAQSEGTAGGGDEEPGKPELAATDQTSSNAPARERFFLGTDEALEKFLREHQDLPPGSDQPTTERKTDSPDPDGPIGSTTTSSQPPSGLVQGSGKVTRSRSPVEVVDAAISSFGGQDVGPARRWWRGEERDTIPVIQRSDEWWEGGIQRILDRQQRRSSGFIHPTGISEAGPPERVEVSASLALATIAAGWIYADAANRKGKTQSRWSAMG